MSDNRQVKKIWEAKVRIKTERGRPNKTWEGENFQEKQKNIE